MARKPKAAAAPASVAAAASPAEAPHWQVARLAEPGQVFTETDLLRNTTTVVADARGVITPRSIAENALIDRLPVAPPDILAAPVPDAPPTEPIDDAGVDAEQED